MIKVTWPQLRDQEVSNAINKLIRQTIDFMTTTKILTIVKKLEDEQKKCDAAWKILMDKYMVFENAKDEEGNPIQGQGRYVNKEGIDEKQAEQDFKDFSEMYSMIRLPKIKSLELQRTQLSPIDLHKIEFMVELPEIQDDDESEEKSPEVPANLRAVTETEATAH